MLLHIKLPWESRLSGFKKTILGFAVICLFFTVTNYLPFSAAIALACICCPLLLVKYATIHRVAAFTLILVGFFAVYVICYNPQNFLHFQFFRRDGNVFITFAPLLVLSLLKVSLDIERVIRLFTYFASFFNAVFLALFFLAGRGIYRFGDGHYHFLFWAHNAAGGFLAVLTCFSLGVWYRKKNWLHLCIVIVNALGLIFTESRGSLLGFMAAYVIVIIFKEMHIKKIVLLTVIAQLILIGWAYGLMEPQMYLQDEDFSVENITLSVERSGNIINRLFYLWPRATYFFLQSPLTGIGFGSFDDRPYVLKGIAGLCMWNVQPRLGHSDSHAHHTFLHVAAETGIIGITLLLLFLREVWFFLKKHPSGVYRWGMQLAFWMSVYSSLTEHRMFTPSQMLPFTILLGLGVASQRNQRALQHRQL